MKLKQASNKKTFAPYNNPFSSLREQRDLSMDWSEDTPVPSSSLPCVPLAGEHILSSHIPLPQGSMDSINVPGLSNPNNAAMLIIVMIT